jgi:hypothetical protein
VSDEYPFGSNTIRVAAGLANVSVYQHGPAFLQRGGAIGRGLSEFSRGRSAREAASIAAKFGKGHAAELRLASEHCVDAAIRELPFFTRPNPSANARHADLEVFETDRLADTAQVGVGSLAYLRRKATMSRAGQVVIPAEAKAAFTSASNPVIERVTDRVAYKGTESRPLSAELVQQDAHSIIYNEILGQPSVSPWLKAGTSVTAGYLAAVDAFATGLLFETVDWFSRGGPFDSSMIKRALLGGARSGLRTVLATHIKVEQFLARARNAFNERILAKVGAGTVWAGAIADVAVCTASDIWRWLKGQITFEELLCRAGVHVFAAVGGAGASILALVALRGAPLWLQILGALAAGWGGTKLGRFVGDTLLSPDWDAGNGAIAMEKER